MLRVRRVYEPAAADDGCRILVDRLWPRGLSKSDAALDQWLKDVAPSTDLRRRFHAGELEFDQFVDAYRAELDANEAVDALRAQVAEHDTVTLLYGSRDAERNHALVLRDWLIENAGA